VSPHRDQELDDTPHPRSISVSEGQSEDVDKDSRLAQYQPHVAITGEYRIDSNLMEDFADLSMLERSQLPEDEHLEDDFDFSEFTGIDGLDFDAIEEGQLDDLDLSSPYDNSIGLSPSTLDFDESFSMDLLSENVISDHQPKQRATLTSQPSDDLQNEEYSSERVSESMSDHIKRSDHPTREISPVRPHLTVPPSVPSESSVPAKISSTPLSISPPQVPSQQRPDDMMRQLYESLAPQDRSAREEAIQAIQALSTHDSADSVESFESIDSLDHFVIEPDSVTINPFSYEESSKQEEPRDDVSETSDDVAQVSETSKTELLTSNKQRESSKSSRFTSDSLYFETDAITSGYPARGLTDKSTSDSVTSKEKEQLRELYDRYYNLKMIYEEPVDGLTYDVFLKQVQLAQARSINEHGWEAVRFTVKMKEGRVVLKAKKARAEELG
jgi:hypothetical protein